MLPSPPRSRRSRSAQPAPSRKPLRDPLRYLKSVLPGHLAAQEEELEKVAAAKEPAVVPMESSEVGPMGEEMACRAHRAARGRTGGAARGTPGRAGSGASGGSGASKMRHEMVTFYAAGTFGPNWNKPTDKQLLAIAAAPTA